ncbi:Lamin-A [Anabarilius grahami]|uniref:Lamin-A n=1 Tax=Anabarilius grahami TaxID=495550 RepID=A0A3N0YSX6_ANAGA|nr:Lamin-A [Anabarilius grahami]
MESAAHGCLVTADTTAAPGALERRKRRQRFFNAFLDATYERSLKEFKWFNAPNASRISAETRYAKKDADLAGTQTRLKDVEALLNSKEAALNTAVSERKALENTLTDLQVHVQEMCSHAEDITEHMLLDRLGIG